MFRFGISDSRVYVFGSNIMQTHIPEGQLRGHPVCRCPSWLVGKELELSVPFNQVLGLEVFHKLNRIVVCDNLFFMRAKILRQNMQQTVLGLLKVKVELLLLFLIHIIEIKERAPGQTPPVIQRVQNFGRQIGQQRIGGPEGVPQLDHPFPPARGTRRRGGMVELADFQAVVAVCLVVGRHVYPRCSRKKRTGESREKNADASVTEQ
jgi:hypothetical protein